MIKINNLEFYEHNEVFGDDVVRIGYLSQQHPKFKEHYEPQLPLGAMSPDYFIIRRKPPQIEVNYWFMSDPHLGQEIILQYDNRPFKTIAEHDAKILSNIQEVVKPGDQLYIVGDMFFYKERSGEAERWLKQCPGQKFFIKGNHDYKETIKLYEKYGVYLGEQKRINILGDNIILNHFPMRSWNHSHYGSYHLYGHHHGNIEHEPYGRSRDVCIRLNNFYPFNWVTQLKPELEKREPYCLQGDHHQNDKYEFKSRGKDKTR